MIGVLLAAALAPPGGVERCVDAVRSESAVVAQACKTDRRPLNIGDNEAVICRDAIEAGARYYHFRSQFADQPRMVAGVRQDFEKRVEACAAVRSAPAEPLPPKTDCKNHQRLWC
jgi:hypothetical protein